MIDLGRIKKRTKQFALEIIRLVGSLPAMKTSDVLGKQLLRSATSVGANYRAACRARSRADFISKIAVVEEEADECLYWLELLDESGLVNKPWTVVTSQRGQRTDGDLYSGSKDGKIKTEGDPMRFNTNDL